MASLQYRQFPQEFLGTPFLARARVEMQRLDGDSSRARIFYAKRKVHTVQNPSSSVLTRVFAAVHPDVENEMRTATDILAKNECEFPIKIQSDRYVTYTEDDGSECHIVSINRVKPPLNPVVLSSNGHEILDTHFLTFQTLLAAVVNGKMVSREEAREKVREVLAIINKDISERVSVEPALVLDGKVIWNRMIILTDQVLDELAITLSSNGMVGPNFVNLPHEDLVQPAYFDFHGHPGYPERWFIPPSISDIWSSYNSANYEKSRAELVLQAVSLRLTTEDFQLFLRPYFRGEYWVTATLDPFIVRIGYLNEVYNTSKERPIGEESYSVLGYLMHASTVVGQNSYIVERIGQFKVLLDEKAGQDVLLVTWNNLIEKIESCVGANVFTKGDWKEILWNMSGGMLS